MEYRHLSRSKTCTSNTHPLSSALLAFQTFPTNHLSSEPPDRQPPIHPLNHICHLRTGIIVVYFRMPPSPLAVWPCVQTVVRLTFNCPTVSKVSIPPNWVIFLVSSLSFSVSLPFFFPIYFDWTFSPSLYFCKLLSLSLSLYALVRSLSFTFHHSFIYLSNGYLFGRFANHLATYAYNQKKTKKIAEICMQIACPLYTLKHILQS